MAKKLSKIEILRHSCAHIMAHAVQKLFRGVKFGIGPAIENGFYYDFDLPRSLTPEDLPKIEKKTRELIKKNFKFIKKDISKSEAKKIFKNQPYKLELIKDLPGKTVSIYQSGDFTDLCQGPHIKSTKEINTRAFKLTKIAGAYWKGDEKNKMLTRIYGVAFSTEKELKKYLKNLREAERRDHRKLGAKLDLFSFHPEAPGMPFWHPNGLIIFNTLIKHWRKIQSKYDYKEIKLPNLLDVNLWKKSGHYEHYKDGMFFIETEDRTMALRPMDCPGAILLYKEKIRSYRDLPMRLSELGVVYRNERSGELHGLFRVQEITQDDAHIFITKQDIESEVTEILKITEKLYEPFDMEKKIYLATKPDDAIGDAKTWDKAEKALRYALEKNKIDYDLKKKDGAFYGPKIDIHINDSIGRTWQTGTIQLDFFMPERFQMEYIDKDSKKKRPVIIHRCLMGSLERFIGILLEHHAGTLPLWLAPEQIWIIPVGSRHEKYAREVGERFREVADFSLRYQIKDENETVSKKIREGELQKIPYILVVGDKEEKAKSVRVRDREKGDIGEMKLDKFIDKIIKETKDKK